MGPVTTQRPRVTSERQKRTNEGTTHGVGRVWATNGAHIDANAAHTGRQAVGARRPRSSSREPRGSRYPYSRYWVHTQYTPYEHRPSNASQANTPAPPVSNSRLVAQKVRNALPTAP